MTQETAEERLERLLKSGFLKQCTFKFLKINENKTVTCTEVDFYADSDELKCGNCGVSDYTILRPERVGVFRSCAWCRMTSGPISKNAGVVRKSYQISVDEAIEILKNRNASRRTIAELQRLRRPRRKIQKKRPRPKIAK